MKTPHFRAVFSALHLSSTHFGPSGEIRTHGLMVPKVRNGVMVYHVLPHLLTAKPLCFQGFERFSI